MIDAYLDELERALHMRGVKRRRVLAECRDHLLDAAAERGEAEAVRAFGSARALAAELDTEVATRRGLRATALTLLGVLATGGSTLVLINGAQPGAQATALSAVVFFIAAQLTATAAALAALQALVQRHESIGPDALALLARRNLTALAGAGVTMFAAGAAVPGSASAPALLAGPVLVCGALVAVLRARRLTRRLDGSRVAATRPPLDDLARLLRTSLPRVRTAHLLIAVAGVAATGAFLRDTAEHATASGAATTAAVEALAVIACFAVFGRELGLRADAGPPRD